MKNEMKKIINEQNVCEIRRDFPILESNLVYFDNAASSQIPKIIVQKMNDYYYNYKANVGRTSGKIAAKSDNLVENIRNQIAKFLGTKNSQIIWTSGSTESLNLTALSLYKYFKRLEIKNEVKNQNCQLKLSELKGKNKENSKIKYHENQHQNPNLEKKLERTLKTGLELDLQPNFDKENDKKSQKLSQNLQKDQNLETFQQKLQTFPCSFRTKSEVIVTQIEHHSNFLVWSEYFEPVFWEIRENTFWLSDLVKLVNQNTKILTITHVSNFTGQILPIKEIIKKIRSISPYICVVLDGSQAVLNLEIDLEDLDCDFYCFSGHKILAPNGIGVLWAKEKWLKILEPPKFGGGMVDKVGFSQKLQSMKNQNLNKISKQNLKLQNQQKNMQIQAKSIPNSIKKTFEKNENKFQTKTQNQTQIASTWQSFPHSWEAGTPNIAGIIGLGAAIDYFENLDQKYDLTKHKTKLWLYLKLKIEQIPDICLINPVIIDPKFYAQLWQEKTKNIENKASKTLPHKFSNSQVPILTFYHTRISSFDLATLLSNFDICLRCGSLCCQPFLRNLQTDSVLRVSLNFYNTKTEIDFFVEKLRQVIEILK